MAFKMKGSAFKLGNVATKSALKQWTKAKGGKKHPKAEKSSDSPLEQGKTKLTDKVRAFAQSLDADSNISDTYDRYKAIKSRLRKDAKDKTAVPMKSPLEQAESPMKRAGIYLTDPLGETEQISKERLKELEASDVDYEGTITQTGKDAPYEKGKMPHHVLPSGEIGAEITEKQWEEAMKKSLARDYELKGPKGNPATGPKARRQAAIIDKTIQDKINRGEEHLLTPEEKEYQRLAIKNINN